MALHILSGMQEEKWTIDQFVTIVILNAKLSARICDPFFASKLRNVFTRFVRVYIAFWRDQNNVAQSISIRVSVCDEALNILEEIEYLKLAPLTPLFSLRCELMRLRLELICQKRIIEAAKHVPKESIEKKQLSNSHAVQPLPIPDTKTRILDFIKRSSMIRVRDVVHEFNLLSDRTVKRKIKELADSGLVKKVMHKNVVHYIPIA